MNNAVARALANPAEALEYLAALRAEDKLIDFIRLMWPVLEPGRPFVDGWVIQTICDHLEAVTDGRIRKLLINVPPGTMKSLAVCVFWPAWVMGPKNRPDKRFISASYADSLSIRDNRKCRSLVTSPLFQKYWGHHFQLMGDQNEKRKWETDKTGWRLATSVGGVGTGERGDVFIIDDPHNVIAAESDLVRDAALQWMSEVVPTRVNDAEKSAFVVVMQRVHERDVSGMILAEKLGYEHLMLPMEFEADRACATSIGFKDPRTEEGELLWPERFSREYLERDLKPSLRAWGGEYAVAGQLQQRPAPRGGGMFQRDNLIIVDEVPKDMVRRVRGWDLAATKDGHGAFTVGLKMGLTRAGDVVILDVRRIRGSPGEVENLVLDCAMTDGPNCQQSLPQDPGQAGVAQKAAYARLLAGHDFHFSTESGTKDDRARPLAAQVEAGRVMILRRAWTEELLKELSTFPMGVLKDQVDAASRAYARLAAKRERKVGSAPKVIYNADRLWEYN